MTIDRKMDNKLEQKLNRLDYFLNGYTIMI
jgi:hypothetical protein